MAQNKIIALGLLCIILSAGLVGAITLLNQTEKEVEVKTGQISELENEKSQMSTQISSLQNEAASLSNEVSDLEDQVSSLETETADLENEKSSLEAQVSGLQSEKEGLETQVSDLQDEVADANNMVTVLEAQVVNLQDEVSGLEDQVVLSYNSGYVEGESDGYQEGYDEGYSQGVEFLTENGVYLRDPTYAEAMAFINADQTDLNPYISPTYVCYDFTADLIANAIQAGYKCGFVYIEFTTSAHAIVCFNTTDQGMIYVEPQNDNQVTVTVGQPYLDYMVVDIGIIW